MLRAARIIALPERIQRMGSAMAVLALATRSATLLIALRLRENTIVLPPDLHTALKLPWMQMSLRPGDAEFERIMAQEQLVSREKIDHLLTPYRYATGCSHSAGIWGIGNIRKSS